PPLAPLALSPPTPHPAQRPPFASLALLASRVPPLSRFRASPIPPPRATGSMVRKRCGQEFFRRCPSTHIPSWCHRHQIPEQSACLKNTREPLRRITDAGVFFRKLSLRSGRAGRDT